MRVAVFGAGGRTGREVVRHAAQAGHLVTAVARRPLPFEPGEGVSVVRADVLDQDAVDAAARGAEAVVSTLGGRPRTPTTVYSGGVQAIGRALRATGATRLVCLSAGALDLGPHVPFGQRVVSRAVVRLLFRDGYADMARMEAQLRGCELDWTVVRVPGLTAKPATGSYRVAEAPLARPSTIARADLASYLVSILGDASTHRKVMEIST
ncbi:MAG: NAD(P)H-binding protein [Pseudonocardia sp.]|nr:NAD(P)H-binding protein [Pseudonocardia sp.]